MRKKRKQHHSVRAEFLYSTIADTRLYCRVPVGAVGNQADGRRVHFPELTELVQTGLEPGRGVLLTTRSVAGTTVAMLVLLYDCFRAADGQSPVLAGHLACCFI